MTEREARIGVSESENDWDLVVGSDLPHHQRTEINCPFHPDTKGACEIDGWSHNTEPQATRGVWRCRGCLARGTWRQAEQHDSTNHHGLLCASRLRMLSL
jgi:hypothetical protein